MPCCNGSLAAFASEDAGASWNLVGSIADKAELNAAGFDSEEGPNEHDVALLADGKTLFAVIRVDGGDGVPTPSPHKPYVFALSTDRGATWALKGAPPFMGSFARADTVRGRVDAVRLTRALGRAWGAHAYRK